MFVRIKSIELKNWRNVESGKITFPCFDEEDDCMSSVTGLYGQNGSGKTTLVYAFSLLQKILSGESYKNAYDGNITKGAKEATLTCEMYVETVEDHLSEVRYEATFYQEGFREQFKAALYDEEKGKRNNLTTLFEVDTRKDNEVLTSDAKREKIFGKSIEVLAKLLAEKYFCAKEQRSFIFSEEFYNELRESKQGNNYADLLLALHQYGKRNLFVLSNKGNGLISLDVSLPFVFHTEHANGTVGVPIDRPQTLSPKIKAVLTNIIETINTVLVEIIPGMQIGIESLGTELMSDGTMGERIQLTRKHKGENGEFAIPLKYESDGIKKIVSLLHVFIATYNNRDITLVVDELDANIFEYLLGELLRIMAESGKGQLIFTAHNLRPLEVLDPNNIVFTTTNPENRYTKMKDIKGNNNLRLCFFRDITLGNRHGDEELYAHTDSLEIAHAMRKTKNNASLCSGEVKGENGNEN